MACKQLYYRKMLLSIVLQSSSLRINSGGSKQTWCAATGIKPIYWDWRRGAWPEWWCCRFPVAGQQRRLKVRVNEMLDKFSLRWMDGVVCVSDGQATKVRRTGISPRRVHVIRNAIQIERFAKIDSAYHELLHGYFPKPPGRIVGAAGRLSPEKGFGVLLQAAELVLQADPHAGFVMFGEGPLRDVMARQIVARGLQDSFILAGFRSDLDCFIPHFDVLALPSFTEGLPNVVLEAFAAAVPVVATAVGGTSEVVENGVNGFLVPPGDPQDLARGIIAVFQNADEGKTLGQRGRQRVREEFTFEAQALQYHRLFTSLMQKCGKASLS